MNFLAHIYLSGNNEKIKLGNFISDFIRGNQYLNYHSEIQKGILLHRAIDNFTDNHEIVKSAKTLFNPIYRLYSGIIVDIFYDHFLTIHWKHYSNIPLDFFIRQSYSIFEKYSSTMPFHTRRIFPSLIYHNWIGQYGSFYGLSKVLDRMTTRTSLPSFTPHAISLLKDNYTVMETNFNIFFEELKIYCEEYLKK